LVAFETFKIIIERFLAIAEKNLHEEGNISVGFQLEASLSFPKTVKFNNFALLLLSNNLSVRF
jgi:hypothetical protein